MPIIMKTVRDGKFVRFEVKKMNKTTKLTITIFTLALLLISGCATQTTQTATQSRENTPRQDAD